MRLRGDALGLQCARLSGPPKRRWPLLLGVLLWAAVHVPVAGADEIDDALGALGDLSRRFDEAKQRRGTSEARADELRRAVGRGTGKAVAVLYRGLRRLSDRGPTVSALFELLHDSSGAQAELVEQLIWAAWFWHKDERLRARMQAANAALQEPGAAALLDGLIEADPGWAEAWNRRATHRYLLGDYEGSLADISETLAREPRHFGAVSGRGLVLAKLGRREEALASQAESARLQSGQSPQEAREGAFTDL
mmetsp:Transcript_122186/g.380424  ORF Transcript_122186/g.380424 Transcript_122186/m.380424 type:complete len:251 (+) Transcript_122186:35-787(+)